MKNETNWKAFQNFQFIKILASGSASLPYHQISNANATAEIPKDMMHTWNGNIFQILYIQWKRWKNYTKWEKY